MKTLDEYKAILADHRKELADRYHVETMAIFGSVTRGDAREDSDIDILVDFDEPIGLDFVQLAEDLEAILGRRVDLVSRNAIKPRYWEYVKRNLVYV